MIKLIVIVAIVFTSLMAETINEKDERLALKKLQQSKVVALYVDKISARIADALSQNGAFKDSNKTTLTILPIVNIHDQNQSSLATIKIAESLIHEMFIRGFHVLDRSSLQRVNSSISEQEASCVLYSTFTNYKDGMIISSRIIETGTSLVHASARVFIAKKELRSINKIYHQYSWFQ